MPSHLTQTSTLRKSSVDKDAWDLHDGGSMVQLTRDAGGNWRSWGVLVGGLIFYGGPRKGERPRDGAGARRTVEGRAGMSPRQSTGVGTTGIHVPTVEWIVDWLRGDQAEKVRADALANDVPPEDALAAVIESRWVA